MTTTGSPRRQDLDLMRAAVVGGLIFFHTARIFDPLDFYVKDQPPNLPLTLFVFFAGLWGMPLLFVVSGLGAWYSLRSRTATGFVRERLARLLVPFLVGLLLVVPPQVYFRLRFEQQDPGSYWQFYGDFFQVHLGLKFPWFIRPDDPPDLFEPAHLWFLYFLLVYSLLLPVLLYPITIPVMIAGVRGTVLEPSDAIGATLKIARSTRGGSVKCGPSMIARLSRKVRR